MNRKNYVKGGTALLNMQSFWLQPAPGDILIFTGYKTTRNT